MKLLMIGIKLDKIFNIDKMVSKLRINLEHITTICILSINVRINIKLLPSLWKNLIILLMHKLISTKLRLKS